MDLFWIMKDNILTEEEKKETNRNIKTPDVSQIKQEEEKIDSKEKFDKFKNINRKSF